MSRVRFLGQSGMVILALAVTISAAPRRIQSAATTARFTIDGLVDEWPQLESLEDTRLSIAAQNDGRNLYLVIATSDQSRRRQITSAGLIIWLDAGGGKKRGFGIRLPGMMATAPPMGRRGMPSAQPPSGSGPGAEQSVAPLTYIEIVGPGDDDRRRLELASTRSLQVARREIEGILTLELQIPLSPNDAAEYAIGARAGSVIGLGLETPKLERPEGPPPDRPGGGGGQPGGMGGGRGGGRGGGGGGGRGGGMGGGGAGGRPGGRGPGGQPMDRPDPLKFWTTLQLAP